MTVSNWLASGIAAAMLAGCAPSAAADPASVSARAGDGGRLTVINSITTAVRLRGAIVVEGFDGRAWRPIVTEMNLVASCPANGVVNAAPDIVLRPAQSFSPPPWRGWSCSGQCETHCRSNVYWGSGPYRFRLVEASGRTIVTNSFRMPASPAR